MTNDVRQVVMTTDEKIASAPVIEDGQWFDPTENPFIHGCCDCGLAHRVEYLIENGALSLRFYRDHEATRMLQARLGVEREAQRQVVSDGLRELAAELRLGHGITKHAAIALALEAADLLTAQPAPSGWQQRIAVMDPWVAARWDSTVCRFCEVERYRMDPTTLKLVEQPHEADCLWQNAKDDPIADAVHAELAPLADALIEAGHTLAKSAFIIPAEHPADCDCRNCHPECYGDDY